MKLLARTILLGLLLTASAVAYGQAQSQQRLYAAIDYMHIPEGKSPDDYVALEKLWQRLHQKAIDAGICRAWYLERVENGGRNDFVTIRVYDSLDKMANPWPDSLRQNLYNSAETEKMRQTQTFRELIHSELWEIEASAGKASNEEMPASVSVQFMKPKPGKESEAYDLETKTWQKIQQARVDAGELKAWYFLSRRFPSGADGEFDYATADASGEKPVWNEKTAEAAVGKDQWAKMADPSTVRTVVRREIWHPLLRTTAAKK